MIFLFGRGFLLRIGRRNDFNANFRSVARQRFKAVFGDKRIACPRNINDFGVVRSLNRAFDDDFAAAFFALDLFANCILQVAVPIGCQAHQDLPESVEFDFERHIPQQRMIDNF